MFEVSWLKAEHFLFVKSVWNMKMISGATSIILHLDGGVLVTDDSLLNHSYHSLLLLCPDDLVLGIIGYKAPDDDEAHQDGEADACLDFEYPPEPGAVTIARLIAAVFYPNGEYSEICLPRVHIVSVTITVVGEQLLHYTWSVPPGIT